MVKRTCDRVTTETDRGPRCGAAASECVVGLDAPRRLNLCQTCVRRLRDGGWTVRVFGARRAETVRS